MNQVDLVLFQDLQSAVLKLSSKIISGASEVGMPWVEHTLLLLRIFVVENDGNCCFCSVRVNFELRSYFVCVTDKLVPSPCLV